MDQNGGNISLDQTTEEYDKNVGMDVGLAPHSAHVLLLPHPAVPHITPMVHLAHQLVSHGGIKCTVLSFDFLLDKVPKGGLSDGIILLGLAKNLTGFSENVTSDSPSPVQNDEELHCTTRAYIEKLLQEKAAGIRVPVYTCVISDYIQGWSIDLCSKLGIPRYLFVASSAFNFLVASSAYLILDTEEGADSRKVNSWLTDSSIPRVTQNCGYLPSVATRKFLCIDPRSYSGVLINTFYEFETHSIDNLRNMGQKVTTVGPLQSSVQVSKVSFGNDKYVDDECLQWLGKQPVKSVLYVNFGTTGFNAFTIQMVHEMALGLEASQARFLWVFRPPPNCKPDEVDKVLPDGFEERVKDRGKISRGWAPQLKILEHPSTAAFFMQCGWNSTLESVARGIPFIGWPTYADQPFNGRYAAEVSKVGLLLPQNETAVDRHDVELAARTIMFSEKGMLLMKRAEEMEIAAAKALKPGGSTHKSFLDFIDIIRPS